MCSDPILIAKQEVWMTYAVGKVSCHLTRSIRVLLFAPRLFHLISCLCRRYWSFQITLSTVTMWSEATVTLDFFILPRVHLPFHPVGFFGRGWRRRGHVKCREPAECVSRLWSNWWSGAAKICCRALGSRPPSSPLSRLTNAHIHEKKTKKKEHGVLCWCLPFLFSSSSSCAPYSGVEPSLVPSKNGRELWRRSKRKSVYVHVCVWAFSKKSYALWARAGVVSQCVPKLGWRRECQDWRSCDIQKTKWLILLPLLLFFSVMMLMRRLIGSKHQNLVGMIWSREKTKGGLTTVDGI